MKHNVEQTITEILAGVERALVCSDVEELDRVCYFLVQAIRHPDIQDARPLSRARLAEALAKLQQTWTGIPQSITTAVETLVAFGTPYIEIARELGIHIDTLRSHYQYELNHGKEKANAKVAGARSGSDGGFILPTSKYSEEDEIKTFAKTSHL